MRGGASEQEIRRLKIYMQNASLVTVQIVVLIYTYQCLQKYPNTRILRPKKYVKVQSCCVQSKVE